MVRKQDTVVSKCLNYRVSECWNPRVQNMVKVHRVVLLLYADKADV